MYSACTLNELMDYGGDHEPAAGVAALAQQLAHPLRVVLLQHVAESGPCPFGELVEASGSTPAQVSNHLALLRRAGLLATQKQGRQSLYRMPNAYLAEVLTNLAAAAGVGPLEGVTRPAEHIDGRRCYDHLGGRLGVDLLDLLLEREALVGDPSEHGELRAGPAANTVLPQLGVDDLHELQQDRRRFAYGCPDWIERRAHLGGSLGAALARSVRQRGWIRVQPSSRALTLTSTGAQELATWGVAR